MALAKVLIAEGYDYYFSDYTFPDIAESRNILTSLWLEHTDTDWMLQVDADMRFGPQLVVDMLRFGKPFTGCLYPMKTYPIQFVGGWSAGAAVKDGFMKVDNIGFGVTLVHRECVTRMVEKGAARWHTPHHDVAQRTIKTLGLTRIGLCTRTPSLQGLLVQVKFLPKKPC